MKAYSIVKVHLDNLPHVFSLLEAKPTLVGLEIMSIDQSDLRIAFFEENDSIQYLLSTFKVAGISSWPDPGLKLIIIVDSITGIENLFIDTVDKKDHMPWAVPSGRDRPKRTIPKEVHSFSQWR
jgi:hypothetical protein